VKMPGSDLYRQFGKRVFDLSVAVSLLIAASPFMVLVWICSLLVLGTPVLFTQRRAGYRGRPFTLYKFRSMLDARDKRGELLPDTHRLTTYGRILRSTSVDELPGLWNVVRGEMTLIGPRPLPVEYTPYYTSEQARRLDVVPGVAGYAALFGRNAQSWEDIFSRDVWYVQHISFLLDLRIICGILGVVLRRNGIDRGDHNRNSEFQKRIESAAYGKECVSRN